MASFVSGKSVRLSIDTSTTAVEAFKTLYHETTASLSGTSETEDVTTKDTDAFSSAIKTATSLTLSLTAKVAKDIPVSSLTYDDLFEFFLETNDSANNGIRKFKLAGTNPGDPVTTFSGFIESIDSDFDAETTSEFSFGIKVTTKPVVTVAT